MYKTKEKIIAWLDKMNIENYIINDDLTVDVNGSVNLQKKRIKKFQVVFGKVYANFNCSNNNLTNLEGSPSFVGGTL